MERIIYNIDSNLRNKTKYPDSHNYTFNTTDQVILNRNNVPVHNVIPFHEENILSLKISSIELPNSFYYINSSRENDSITQDSSEKTIDTGSYTMASLVTEITSKLTSVTVSKNAKTNKITLTNGAGSDTTLNFSNNTSYMSLGRILGFKDTEITITGSGGTKVSDYSMSNPKEEYVFLKINNIGNIINNNNRYIAKIILDTDFGETTRDHHLKSVTKEIHFSKPTDIKNLEIGLYDLNDNLISLNGSEFSFTLELKKINNSIIQNYANIFQYNDETLNKIVTAKQLEYYSSKPNIPTNNDLSTVYSNQMNNIFDHRRNF